jgi:hypothetical protein
MISFTHLPSTLLAYSLPLSIFLVATVLVFFVLLPFKKIQSYKKDGVTTHFFPILGFFKYMQDSEKNTGDVMGALKQATKQIKDPKYKVTHLVRTPVFMLQAPQYIKEFSLKQNQYEKGGMSDVIKLLAGSGLVGAEGETWKRHRKIISSSFNFEFLKTNIPVILNNKRILQQTDT